MKVFFKYFAVPLLIGVLASIFFIIDSLVAGLFIKNSSFLWAGFVVWTLFYGASINERIRGFIGVIVGFICSIVMMLITSLFTLNLYTISISSLLGVFVVNCLVMYMNKGEKIWLNSVSGAFVGIALSFSGLGVKLSPISSVSNGFLMLAIILTYTIFGLIAGFCSTYFTNKINNKLAQIDSPSNNDKQA